MKYLITFLLAFTAFVFNASAQNTGSCNPAFTSLHQSGKTIKFTPALANDSPLVEHYWYFGDNYAGFETAPVHTYSLPGVYQVKHVIYRYNPNGVYVCSDSAMANVIAEGPCNLVADFFVQGDGQHPLIKYFSPAATPQISFSDSTVWSFGDGTSSTDFYPAHTYTSPGTYTVCLRIRTNNTAPGTQPCRDTVCRQVIISACDFQVYFSNITDTQNLALIHFTNQTPAFNSGDSAYWTFGDGSTSTQNNPDHLYANPGTYNVCLLIRKFTSAGTAYCVREYCKQVTIAPPSCTLVAAFTVSHDTAGINTNNYHFTNTSTPLAASDSVRWTFGDGTSSGQVSPNHVYAQSGTYNVCLRIIKRNANGTLTNCIKEVCHTITVVLPNPCTLVAAFTVSHDTAGANTNNYHFTNTSSPFAASDSVRWTFGDGTSSNQINPTHVYAQPGTYTVCLRIIKRNPNGVLTSCIKDTCRTIDVVQPCNIHPHYSWRADSVNYRKIYFTNTSVPVNTNATALWSFGDGTTATSWNAVHEYAQAGTYYVCLRLSSGSCVAYFCDSIRISPPAPPCSQLSNYHFTRSAADSQTYYFAPNYISNTIQYTWTFGDGTGAQGANAMHHFSAAGNYTVCLTAFKNTGCASTTCNTVQVHAQPNCSTSTIDYNYHRDSLVPNRITFTAYSNTTITDQVWTITKQPATAGTGTATIHANNPTYVFIDTGYYRVCLRATLANGCIKEYCSNVYINQTMPTTNSCVLQAYPNPAGAEVHVNISLAQPLVLYGYIYNSANVLVAQKQQQGIVGNNIFTMNTANLPAGIYTIRLVYGNAVCTGTFIK